MNLFASLFLAAITVVTWNGDWFPSHEAKRKTSAEQNAANVASAGRLLNAAIFQADPQGTNDLIICLNEMRNSEVVDELLHAIGRKQLTVAAVSRYRLSDRYDIQQDAILTTLPIIKAGWKPFAKKKGRFFAPRGYAIADLLFSPSVTGRVFSTHLKANYGQKTAQEVQKNHEKRLHSVHDLVSVANLDGAKDFPKLICGDFNINVLSNNSSDLEVYRYLESNGYKDAHGTLSASKRPSYVGRGKYKNTVLDYIFYQGLKAPEASFVYPESAGSDHRPVVTTFQSPR